MYKAAVIFESSPFDRKGLFNAAHNRILNLVETGECQVDAYCIHSWDTDFTRKVRHTPVVEDRCEICTLDGIDYRMLWYDFSILDHITVEKFHLKPLFFSRFVNDSLGMFKDYDVVVAHSFTGGLFALEISRSFGIPYVVTWHGSDVHTHPWRNPLILKTTRQIMKHASCNCFVSSALLKESGKIISGVRKEILYNGVSDVFVKLSEAERDSLRTKYGVMPNEKVVAFVGSIVEVKNVNSLQPIFHQIRTGYEGPLKFWMVGDGKLRGVIEPVINADESLDVHFWGNVPADEMPSVLNCVDLMLLPSLNEGLPLVCAEAIRCGASVIGSEVGGIPEVIGRDYTVPLGDDFVEEMAAKAIDVLNTRTRQSFPEELNWKTTAGNESRLLKSLIKK